MVESIPNIWLEEIWESQLHFQTFSLFSTGDPSESQGYAVK